MISKIITQFGKVKHACLIGPPYDIHRVYLYFVQGNLFKIEIKGSFYMQDISEDELHSQSDREQLSPEHAYVRLASCGYEDPKAIWPVATPDKRTVQIVLDLLLESV